jgi:hypothetical protein
MGKLKIKIMKKIVIFVFVIVYSLSYSQEQATKKFQLGFSYSLTNEDEIFKNPFSGFANYQVKQWDNLDINAGLKVYYFSSKESANFSNKLGFNPNISSSYYFAKNKLNANVAIGYYFDSFTSTPTITGIIVSPEREIKTNGITLAPGIKYFFNPNIFIDTNATFLMAKTKDDFYKDTTGNNTFINLGFGFAF